MRFRLVFSVAVCLTVPMQVRQARIKRDTKETRITIQLNLDGSGKSSIKTGIPFFDHMLTLFAKHAVVDLKLRCNGDLGVDAHHTVEDCGIALGQAVLQALGDKKGIRRYGNGFHPKNPFTGEAYVPMDECLARCVIDFSGRPYLVWRGLDRMAFRTITDAEKRQGMSSAFRFGLAREFFQGFANEARCNLHLELLYGDEPHHVVEGLFKAFARLHRQDEVEGTGAGLAICKRLIEMHGGSIGVHSTGEEGGGSTFYFTLPTVSLPDAPVKGLRAMFGGTEYVLVLTNQAASGQRLEAAYCSHLSESMSTKSATRVSCACFDTYCAIGDE